MNVDLYIAHRITFKSKKSFSKWMIRIGIATVALGVAVMIVSYAILLGFKSTIRDKITGFQGHIQIFNFSLNNSIENKPMEMNKNLEQQLTQLPNYKASWPYIQKVGMLRFNNEIEPIICKGITNDFNFEFLSKRLIEGTIPPTIDTTTNFCIISSAVAKKLNIKLSDGLYVYFSDKNLKVRKLIVTGIYSTGVEELDQLYLFCNMQVLQKVNAWNSNQIVGYEVELDKYDALVLSANALFEQLDMELTGRTINEIYPQIFDWLNLLDVNTQVILILMIIVAGINMISALLILILEKASLVGVLKSLGLTNARLRNIFLYQGVYLVIVGLIIGNMVGISFCLLQEHFQWITLDPKNYYVSYVPIQMEWMPIILINLGTLIISIIILWIPSRLIHRITPVRILRFN